MRLPARTVERAGTGDLTSRATTDAGLVAFVLRDAAPDVLFALVQTLIIVTAVLLLSPLLGAVGLVALVAIPLALRWYLRRARPAYLAESAARADVADVLATTAAGARTVEVLGLQRPRSAACARAVTAANDALRDVGADWIDELPDRLDTDLGTHSFSGAQAQHIALARVLLANPHTLVLDEATALLDPTAARHTERALAAAVKGRTVIAMAHRLHTTRDADRIAVMDAGRITELGAHHELTTATGAYAALWEVWKANPSEEQCD